MKLCPGFLLCKALYSESQHSWVITFLGEVQKKQELGETSDTSQVWCWSVSLESIEPGVGGSHLLGGSAG